MAVTIASINLSGGNTIITVNLNGTFVSDPAGLGLTVGFKFYSGGIGTDLTVASISSADITLTGQWSPTPSVGAELGAGEPLNVILVSSYSFNGGNNTTSISLNMNGTAYTGTVNVGDSIEVNSTALPVVSVDGGGSFTVSGGWFANIQGAVATIIAGASDKKQGLIPTEGRVPTADLTPDVRDVPREDLIPDANDKNHLIPS